MLAELSPVALTLEGVALACPARADEPAQWYDRFRHWVLVGGPEAIEYLPITCDLHGHLTRPELVAGMRLYHWHDRYGNSPYPAIYRQYKDRIDAHVQGRLPRILRGLIGQIATTVQLKADQGVLGTREMAELDKVLRGIVETDRIRAGLASDPGMPGAAAAESEMEQYERLTPTERIQYRRLRAVMRGERKCIDATPVSGQVVANVQEEPNE